MTAKVFGIGFQRTGTGSLARALELLGYRTVHTPLELFDDPAHRVLEAHDAFTDNPIPLLVAHLDGRYPGSRFVFTDRDVDRWLPSVAWLFEEGLRRAWGGTGKADVIDRMHEALYGRRDFDEAVFRTRFLAHRAHVADYFSARAPDLLVLPLGHADPWGALCGFLGRARPLTPYPHQGKRTAG